MNFPEHFFEEEERSGFVVSEMMKRAWAAQMEEYLVLEEICDRHGLKMVADYGTLLGAVRHKGFVPWDDDMDVAMPRADFMKLIEIAPKELPEGYAFVSIYNNPDYTNVISRFMGAVTISTEPERMKRFHGFPYPSGIDIFPMDYIPRASEEFEMWKQLVNLVSTTQNAMTDGTASEEELAEILPFIEETCHVRFKPESEESLAHQMAILTDKLYALYGDDDADHIGIAHLQPFYEHCFVPKDILNRTIDLPFEGITVRAPENYHDYLVMRYGESYMTPHQYIPHEYPFYAQAEALYQEFLKNHEVGEGGVTISYSGIN